MPAFQMSDFASPEQARGGTAMLAEWEQHRPPPSAGAGSQPTSPRQLPSPRSQPLSPRSFSARRSFTYAAAATPASPTHGRQTSQLNGAHGQYTELSHSPSYAATHRAHLAQAQNHSTHARSFSASSLPSASSARPPTAPTPALLCGVQACLQSLLRLARAERKLDALREHLHSLPCIRPLSSEGVSFPGGLSGWGGEGEEAATGGFKPGSWVSRETASQSPLFQSKLHTQHHAVASLPLPQGGQFMFVPNSFALWLLFTHLDSGGKGYVSVEDYAQFLSRHCTPSSGSSSDDSSLAHIDEESFAQSSSPRRSPRERLNGSGSTSAQEHTLAEARQFLHGSVRSPRSAAGPRPHASNGPPMPHSQDLLALFRKQDRASAGKLGFSAFCRALVPLMPSRAVDDEFETALAAMEKPFSTFLEASPRAAPVVLSPRGSGSAASPRASSSETLPSESLIQSRLSLEQEGAFLDLLLAEITAESERNFDALHLAHLGRARGKEVEVWEGHSRAAARAAPSASSSSASVSSAPFDLIDVYAFLDREGDGFMDADSLRASFARMGHSDTSSSASTAPTSAEMAQLIYRLDRDNDGQFLYIDWAELFIPYAELKPYRRDESRDRTWDAQRHASSFPPIPALPPRLMHELLNPPAKPMSSEQQAMVQEQKDAAALIEQQRIRALAVAQSVANKAAAATAAAVAAAEAAEEVQAQQWQQQRQRQEEEAKEAKEAEEMYQATRRRHQTPERHVSFGGEQGPSSPRHSSSPSYGRPAFRPQSPLSPHHSSSAPPVSTTPLSPIATAATAVSFSSPRPSALSHFDATATAERDGGDMHMSTFEPTRSFQWHAAASNNPSPSSPSSSAPAPLHNPVMELLFRRPVPPPLFVSSAGAGSGGLEGPDALVGSILSHVRPEHLASVLPEDYPFRLGKATEAPPAEPAQELQADGSKSMAQVRREQLDAYKKAREEAAMQQQELMHYTGTTTHVEFQQSLAFAPSTSVRSHRDQQPSSPSAPLSSSALHSSMSPAPHAVPSSPYVAPTSSPALDIRSRTGGGGGGGVEVHVRLEQHEQSQMTMSSTTARGSPHHRSGESTSSFSSAALASTARTASGGGRGTAPTSAQRDRRLGSPHDPPSLWATPAPSSSFGSADSASTPLPVEPRFSPSFPLRFPAQPLAQQVHQTLYFPLPLGVPSAMLPLSDSSLPQNGGRMAGEIGQAALVASLASAQDRVAEAEQEELDRRREMREKVQRITGAVAERARYVQEQQQRASSSSSPYSMGAAAALMPSASSAGAPVQAAIVPMNFGNTSNSYAGQPMYANTLGSSASPSNQQSASSNAMSYRSLIPPGSLSSLSGSSARSGTFSRPVASPVTPAAGTMKMLSPPSSALSSAELAHQRLVQSYALAAIQEHRARLQRAEEDARAEAAAKEAAAQQEHLRQQQLHMESLRRAQAELAATRARAAAEAAARKAVEDREAARRASEERDLAAQRAAAEFEASRLRAQQEREAASRRAHEEREAANRRAQEEREAASLRAQEEREAATRRAAEEREEARRASEEREETRRALEEREALERSMRPPPEPEVPLGPKAFSRAKREGVWDEEKAHLRPARTLARVPLQPKSPFRPDRTAVGARAFGGGGPAPTVSQQATPRSFRGAVNTPGKVQLLHMHDLASPSPAMQAADRTLSKLQAAVDRGQRFGGGAGPTSNTAAPLSPLPANSSRNLAHSFGTPHD